MLWSLDRSFFSSSLMIFRKISGHMLASFNDGCVLYRNIKSPIDCQILQDDLNSLLNAQWETDWQMNVNVAKFNVIR